MYIYVPQGNENSVGGTKELMKIGLHVEMTNIQFDDFSTKTSVS